MASSQTTTPSNWSLQAIPAAFALGLVPHIYGQTRLMIETKNQQSVAMPRTNLDTWRSKLPAATWNHLARARGAHLNSMEVFPLFAAAMIAGNVAQLPVKDMNNMALGFFEARAVYIALYLSVKSNSLAYARTAAYAWSIAIPLVGLWQAGKTIAAQDV